MGGVLPLPADNGICITLQSMQHILLWSTSQSSQHTANTKQYANMTGRRRFSGQPKRFFIILRPKPVRAGVPAAPLDVKQLLSDLARLTRPITRYAWQLIGGHHKCEKTLQEWKCSRREGEEVGDCRCSSCLNSVAAQGSKAARARGANTNRNQ